MTYKNALEYINSLESLGIIFGLSNILKVLKHSGNPEKSLKFIHIAGTNGKGSVAAMVSSVLKEASFKVGLYTSPHLVELAERIQLNGRKIPSGALADITGRVKGLVESLCVKLTYFEFVTVVAFIYFAREKTDIVVLETGMGGRLDATNVIKTPLVSVITNIDFEHTEYLGKTLKSITGEKAGIIKKNSAVITGVAIAEALNVIVDACRKKNSRLFCLGRDISTDTVKAGSRFQEFNYNGIFSNYRGLKLQLRGKHQVQNAALSVAAIEALRLKGVHIKEKHIRRGIYKAKWPGRLELVRLKHSGREVRIILDGAHNSAGIFSLREFLLGKTLAYNRLILVLGILADKDYKMMISAIVPLADRVILVAPKTTRALDRPSLKREAMKYIDDKKICIERTVVSGISRAIDIYKTNNLICVAGSLYVIGEAMKFRGSLLRRRRVFCEGGYNS